jgi:hypothetical protein
MISGNDFDKAMYGWDLPARPMGARLEQQQQQVSEKNSSSSKDFFRQIYFEDDQSATVSRMGAEIAQQAPIKFGGKTPVDLHPEMKPPTSAETTSDTVRDSNRSDKIDFPQQRGPTNPIDHIRQMYTDSIAQQTRRAQQRQSGKYREQE